MFFVSASDSLTRNPAEKGERGVWEGDAREGIDGGIQRLGGAQERVEIGRESRKQLSLVGAWQAAFSLHQPG